MYSEFFLRISPFQRICWLTTAFKYDRTTPPHPRTKGWKLLIVTNIAVVAAAFNRASANGAWNQLSKLTMAMNWIMKLWQRPSQEMMSLINILFIICVWVYSGGSRISQGTNPRREGAPTYDFVKFRRKLLENEEI